MVRLFLVTIYALLLATALPPGAVSAAPALLPTAPGEPVSSAPVAGTVAPSPGAGVVLSGFRMVQDQGPRRWEIRSREAVYDGQNSAALQGVDADLIESDVRTLTVSGSSGRYRSDTRVLLLEGKVRARTLSGYDFTAGKMEWRGGEALVTATGGVTLNRHPFTVKGKGLTHRTDTNTTVMAGGITATWAGTGSGGGRE